VILKAGQPTQVARYERALPWTGFDDISRLVRPPGAPVTAYDAMTEGIGYGSAPQQVLTRPGIGQLGVK
jgi:hypothetical protein